METRETLRVTRRRFVITAYPLTKQPIEVILYDDMKKILNLMEQRKFDKFIDGQTMLLMAGGQAGIYPCDFERFVKGLPVID